MLRMHLGVCLAWIGLAGMAPPGAGHSGAPEVGRAGTDSLAIEQARLTDGWCEPSGPGFVARVRIDSRALYEIIDAHGHTVDRAGIHCSGCLRAIAVNGFCETSEIGYVNGLAYVSRLAYLLALGTRVDPSRIECPTCRAHLEEPGWCASCSRGLVGNVAYDNRQHFERMQEERQRLLAATQRIPVCEYCAVVAFADGRCPRCNIVYRNGKPVAPGRPG